jgi:deoxyribonuclease-4
MTKRIGIHLGTAGGASSAVERAREIGANTFQIFSPSLRMWRATQRLRQEAAALRIVRSGLNP